MPWAKLCSHARFNLATSGVASWRLSDLPVKIEDLEINGAGEWASAYGCEPLQAALAAHCGVSEERIVAAAGTSMANYLAMAATLERGDDVLIEQPSYELLPAAASLIGARVIRFPRKHQNGFALDPEDVKRNITARTSLVVVTNLHNPSSSLAGEEAIREVGEIARGVGARVLVDEVYLDAAFERAPRSAALLGDHFLVTSSLTKVYGLSGLRCGWVIAESSVATKMWLLNDLFSPIPAHIAERLSVIALKELPRIAAATRERLDTNRAVLNRFFESRDDLECAPLEFGTVAFPKLRQGDVGALCDLLRTKYETTVVPGKFFDMPDHFRVGIGGDRDTLEEGLRRLGAALDECAVLQRVAV